MSQTTQASSEAEWVGRLLAYQASLTNCRSRRELQFAIVNEGVGLLGRHQAWLGEPGTLGRLQPSAVSGLADLDRNTPFSFWFSHLCQWALDEDLPVVVASPDRLSSELAREGSEWMPAHALGCRLLGPREEPLGILWLCRDEPFSTEEREVAAWIARQAGFALWGWRSERSRLARVVQRVWGRRLAWLTLAVVFVLGCIPVRLSVLAPGEVTPLQPTPVTAPTDGVVQRVWVAPSQPVKAGDLLVTFDDTVIRNRLQVARKTLDIARAESQRAASKAFADDQSKAELQILDARTREKAAEVAYLAELLERMRITAPVEGVAVFADASDWIGKPVQTGERIMLLSDPQAVELTLHVSADDAIPLAPGTKAQMYLNVSPLSSLAATVHQTSYEPLPTAEGNAAYVLKARLDDSRTPPRLGLKGTAKLFAEPVSLAYYLLRKPIAWLRRASGL